MARPGAARATADCSQGGGHGHRTLAPPVFPRSFRARLSWFFVIVVVLPLVAVTAALLWLVSDAQHGRSDARADQARLVARGVVEEAGARAARVGWRVAGEPELGRALRTGDDRRVERVLRGLAEREGVVRLELARAGGGAPRRVQRGRGRPVAPATTRLLGGDGSRVGTLKVSTASVESLARDLARYTGLQARTDGTVPQGFRAAEPVAVPAWDAGGDVPVQLLVDEREAGARTADLRLAILAVLLVFLALAFALAFTLRRAVQGQVQALLAAARRIGGGELDVRVPAEGGDELAQLGAEFNAMAGQLRARMTELESERARLTSAIRRAGESFASNLDRDALLRIIVATAVDGVGASVGRARLREPGGEGLTERVHVGAHDGFEPVLDAVEMTVLAEGRSAELDRGELHAISHPLKPSEAGSSVLGLMTVARPQRAFSDAERELFHYLASQASVSIENVDLHQAVRRQALTDELTGLFNHRRFQEVVAHEVERARRFGDPLGLVMLDLDDFKAVNDRYGHLQGDLVLREVARVLRDTAREVDEPARYGGEELAVALPQTDLAGTRHFAERLRERIEALEVPLIGGSGSLRVTASLGAAALPETASPGDKDGLVAAADAALYEAKRLGKNRVVAAG